MILVGAILGLTFVGSLKTPCHSTCGGSTVGATSSLRFMQIPLTFALVLLDPEGPFGLEGSLFQTTKNG